MESNSTYTAFMRHIFLLLAVLFFATSINDYFFDGMVTINGEKVGAGWVGALVFFVLGCIMLLLWLSIKDKVVQVRLGGQNITLYLQDTEAKVNWFEVESLEQVPIVNPPMYKLRVRNRPGYYLFISTSFSINIGGGVYDASDMGSFIRKKKKEVGI